VATPPSIPIVSPGEEESGERPADAQQRAAGLSKAELAKALPDLISSLKTEQTLDGQVEVVVRAEGPQVPAGLQRLGFKDGDIITRVNRTAIESAEQAQRALANVKNDLGFTIRVVRDGQSSWMRISVSEAAPSPKGAPDSAKRPVLPPPQPPAKPPAAEQAAPAEEPAPSTEEPPETPSDEPPK
jgi:membrane-associated protease RseP (regulator of RpoE activity)